MTTPKSPIPPPSETTSAATRVAVAIRTRIIDGSLLPGERLPEERFRAELEVSRSTLREGFQLLTRERLMVHRLSRGFFVRELSCSDISDLYTVRRILECSALRQVTLLLPQSLRDIAQAIADGKLAAADDDWQKVAAASIGFHQALVGLAGSPRLNALAEQVLAEFRLSYSYMDDPSSFHAPFLERNVKISEMVRSGDLEGSALALGNYLRDSERALLAHYAASERQTSR